MKERPILFSAPMVRALLAGTKTQTRRIVKPQPTFRNDHLVTDLRALLSRCPYGAPGDRLWVRETWLTVNGDDTFYRADYLNDPEGDRAHGVAWRPSIHMPRARSRITLEVTGVRVERLQAISEADAKAEGAPDYVEGVDPPPDDPCSEWSYRASFRRLWESINGAGSWPDNPWVWVVEFKRL